MITPKSLALLIANGIKSHEAKLPVVKRALGSSGPFPYPTHLGVMMEIYDDMWMPERAGELIDSALVIKMYQVEDRQKKFKVIKALIEEGGLTIDQQREFLRQSLMITEEIEQIVLAMESVSA